MTTDSTNETNTAADANPTHSNDDTHDETRVTAFIRSQFPQDDTSDALRDITQDDTHGEDVIAEGVLDSEQILERTVLYALDQGVEMLEQNGGFEPFTVLISGEELYIEDQPGETAEESYASARRTIYQMERMCNAYVFCYDGYVELEDGTNDAIVVEYANRDDKNAQIIVKVYHQHGDHYHFDETLYQVGETETLFGDSEQSEKEDAVDENVVSNSEVFRGATDIAAAAVDFVAAAAEVATGVSHGVVAAGEIALDGVAAAGEIALDGISAAADLL